MSVVDIDNVTTSVLISTSRANCLEEMKAIAVQLARDKLGGIFAPIIGAPADLACEENTLQVGTTCKQCQGRMIHRLVCTPAQSPRVHYNLSK